MTPAARAGTTFSPVTIKNQITARGVPRRELEPAAPGRAREAHRSALKHAIADGSYDVPPDRLAAAVIARVHRVLSRPRGL